MFNIEKNVPIPERKVRKGQKYPFADMQVGDSFTFTKDDYPRVSSAMRTYAWKSESRQFTIRRVDDGFRCWRLPDAPPRNL